MDTQRVAPAAPRVGDSVCGVLRDVDPLDLSLWRQVVEADRSRCQPVSRLWRLFILHLPLAIMGHLSRLREHGGSLSRAAGRAVGIGSVYAAHEDSLECLLASRHHPFFTNTDLPTAEADITHRQHAIIETVFSDLIDGPLAHIPSGQFGANSAWVLCAAIAHNLLRAAGVLAGGAYAVARGATLRRKIVTIP